MSVCVSVCMFISVLFNLRGLVTQTILTARRQYLSTTTNLKKDHRHTNRTNSDQLLVIFKPNQTLEFLQSDDKHHFYKKVR